MVNCDHRRRDEGILGPTCVLRHQEASRESDLSSRVVKDLTRTFTGKNHHVFCDNYFSSVKLAADLLKDDIYLTATTRTNRKDFPKELARTTPAIKHLKQGESKFLRKCDVVASVWMDKKPVTFLSIYSNPEGAETVKRKQRDGTVIDVPSLRCNKLQQKYGWR